MKKLDLYAVGDGFPGVVCICGDSRLIVVPGGRAYALQFRDGADGWRMSRGGRCETAHDLRRECAREAAVLVDLPSRVCLRWLERCSLGLPGRPMALAKPMLRAPRVKHGRKLPGA